MKKMTMLQVARKFQENAIKATEHPILDKILAKTKQKKNTIKGMKRKKVKNEVNWHQIIALASAGQYIQNQLNEELSKVVKNKGK